MRELFPYLNIYKKYVGQRYDFLLRRWVYVEYNLSLTYTYNISSIFQILAPIYYKVFFRKYIHYFHQLVNNEDRHTMALID